MPCRTSRFEESVGRMSRFCTSCGQCRSIWRRQRSGRWRNIREFEATGLVPFSSTTGQTGICSLFDRFCHFDHLLQLIVQSLMCVFNIAKLSRNKNSQSSSFHLLISLLKFVSHYALIKLPILLFLIVRTARDEIRNWPFTQKFVPPIRTVEFDNLSAYRVIWSV